MATKTLYRILNLQTGHISMADWCYDGYVELDKVEIEYEDQLTPAHAQMVADAIDKRVQKLNADIVVMQHKKQDFLAIAYSEPKVQEQDEPVWEEVDESDGRG